MAYVCRRQFILAKPYESSSRVAAYEYLWTRYPSVPKLAKLFSSFNHELPSVVAQAQDASPGMLEAIRCKIADLLPFRRFSALFYGNLEYPKALQDAKNPIELLYYQGNLDLLSSEAVAVVGSRKPQRKAVGELERLPVCS